MVSIYVETTVISYLAARPSRDLVVAGYQQVTHAWWARAKGVDDLHVSILVLDEISAGDPVAVQERLALVAELPVLQAADEVESLQALYRARPELAHAPDADIGHLAFAVAYRMDYLATWNCAHIANPVTLRLLADVNHARGLWLPIVVTPSELLGE